MFGPEIIMEAERQVQIVRENLKVAQSQQKSYADTLKRPLIREDLNVFKHQSQEADDTFIISDGSLPYNSTR